MELQELYSLMERFSRSGLAELNWQKKDEQILLRRASAPLPTAPAAPLEAAPEPNETVVPEDGELVKAPLVGTFYVAPAPGEAPFAAPGQRLKKGETLCLIEAMKMMSEVPAPADCMVDEVLAQDGDAVGYDTPLFRIRRI